MDARVMMSSSIVEMRMRRVALEEDYQVDQTPADLSAP